MHNKVNDDALFEYIICILLYRKALNEYGWKKLGYDEKIEKEFCEENSGECATLICNEFALDLFPIYIKKYNYLN